MTAEVQKNLFADTDLAPPPAPRSCEPDVCASRHRGNPESVAAHAQRRSSASRQREEVFEAILRAGEEGLTVDELAARWGRSPNQISGRFSELKRDKRIEKIGTRKTRAGTMAGVCVACSHTTNDQQRATNR